jgi:hypothetical protein
MLRFRICEAYSHSPHLPSLCGGTGTSSLWIINIFNKPRRNPPHFTPLHLLLLYPKTIFLFFFKHHFKKSEVCNIVCVNNKQNCIIIIFNTLYVFEYLFFEHSNLIFIIDFHFQLFQVFNTCRTPSPPFNTNFLNET